VHEKEAEFFLLSASMILGHDSPVVILIIMRKELPTS
jgi:hypothetical protein